MVVQVSLRTIYCIFQMEKSQIGTETDKNSKSSSFQRFYAILLKFRQTWWIRMLNTLNMAPFRSPVGFSGKIIVVFQMKKNLKLKVKVTSL